MFTVDYIGPTGEGKMAPHAVNFSTAEKPTVDQFIRHVLNNREEEQGCIKVEHEHRYGSMQYSHGTVMNYDIPEDFEQLQIKLAQANGGSGRMDYQLSTL